MSFQKHGLNAKIGLRKEGRYKMTGEKNRNSTVEKLWKLDDETLKTPKHDEMVLWLLNVENIYKILPKLCNERYYRFESDTDYESFHFFKDVEFGRDEDGKSNFWKAIQEKDYSCKVVPNQRKEEWKKYIDDYHTIGYNGYNLRDLSLKISSEVPISTSSKFIVGYWDIVIEKKTVFSSLRYFYLQHKTGESNIYIEVKPRIDSFGATLRQLRTYQEYAPDSVGNTYLFTDDLRFKEAFESQGIQVISREKGEEK
jgi:hypothetical protein